MVFRLLLGRFCPLFFLGLTLGFSQFSSAIDDSEPSSSPFDRHDYRSESDTEMAVLGGAQGHEANLGMGRVSELDGLRPSTLVAPSSTVADQLIERLTSLELDHSSSDSDHSNASATGWRSALTGRSAGMRMITNRRPERVLEEAGSSDSESRARFASLRSVAVTLEITENSGLVGSLKRSRAVLGEQEDSGVAGDELDSFSAGVPASFTCAKRARQVTGRAWTTDDISAESGVASARGKASMALPVRSAPLALCTGAGFASASAPVAAKRKFFTRHKVAGGSAAGGARVPVSVPTSTKSAGRSKPVIVPVPRKLRAESL